MRILFINKASLRHEGGAEIRTREVGKRLVLSGHDIVVLAAKTNINEPSFEIYEGMKLYHKKVLPDWVIRRFPAPSYLPLAAANLFLMFHLYFFLKKERFDIIREDVSPFPPSFLLALVRIGGSAAPGVGVSDPDRLPVVQRIAVAHNLPGTLKRWLRFYGPVYGTAGFLFYRLMRANRLKYDRIVCAAKWFADELKRFPAIGEKVGYVPNGIDPERFSANALHPLPSPLPFRHTTGGHARERGEQAIRLLAVGRLVEMKGFRFLIEALSCLKREYPQMKLTILGKGPLKDPLIRLARQLNLESRVEIRPPVPYEEMPRIYRQYDFLVAPFLSEGFPMVILEAMAAQLPIVASDIPGVRGILDEDSATLAGSQNAEGLADKLKWALEHPEEVNQKVEAACQISKKYNWDLIARQEVESGCPLTIIAK